MGPVINRSAIWGRLGSLLKLEAALFVASVLGAFTLSGYAYLEGYYLTLDVAIARLDIGTQQILSYGAAQTGSYVGVLTCVIALVGIAAFFTLLLEKKRQMPKEPLARPRWVEHVVSRTTENGWAVLYIAAICVVAGLLIFARYLLIAWPSSDGRYAALKEASTCVERQVVYANLDHYKGCQVAESADMLYLLRVQKCDTTGVTFTTLQLPKMGIKNITSESVFYPYERASHPKC